MIGRYSLAVIAVLLAVGAPTAQAAPIPAPTTRVEVQPLPPVETAAAKPVSFDADKATNAYLATISGQARASSDSYFEGGYWLLLVDALYALAISALLLWGRVSAWMRTRAMKTMFVVAGAFAMLLRKAPDGLRNGTVKFFMAPAWQTAVYAVMYIVLTTVLTFPLTVYEGFFREHAYGLSNQNFMQWFGEFGINFVLNIVGTALALSAIYAAIRRAKQTWWVWGTLLSVGFLVIILVIGPVFIAPLFNTYKPMAESPLQQKVLSLARANGIPATNVYVFDASKQTKRISANVSGFMGTTRISLNDNLLKRTSEGETLAVLGHEMGHYALDHVIRLLIMMGLVVLLGFAVAAWGYDRLARRYGARWGVGDVSDVAGLPVLMAIATVYILLMTPVTNTISRTTEAQADIFGLNAARQPDGFAKAALQVSEYRKLDPSPLEEIVFYDHPSGRSRISMSMHWKAEHLDDPDIKAGPPSPQ